MTAAHRSRRMSAPLAWMFRPSREAEADERVMLELFRPIFGSTKSQLASIVVAAIITAYLVFNGAPASFIIWCAIGACLIVLRILLIRQSEARLKHLTLSGKMNLYTFVTLLYGVLWGSGYALVPYDNLALSERVFFILLISHCGFMGGSIMLHVSWRPAIDVFLVPSILLGLIITVSQGTATEISGMMLVPFVCFIQYFYGWRMHRIVINSISAELLNKKLANELALSNLSLIDANDAATRASRAKSAFLAGMSHEIRTPLNSIIGFSELMTGEVLGKMQNVKYLEYAHDIQASGAHLLALINDVLDLSKIEAGKFKLDMEVLDIVPIANGCIRLMAERAMEAGVELKLEKEVAGCKILADERRMKQVMLNLVTNAIKFTPHGGRVVITASIANDRAQLSVADTGIGMSSEDIPKALAPFEQLDSALSKSRQGTGLGLPLTKNLVELHDGTLTIASVPGHGTTVLVSLPILKMSSDKR